MLRINSVTDQQCEKIVGRRSSTKSKQIGKEVVRTGLFGTRVSSEKPLHYFVKKVGGSRRGLFRTLLSDHRQSWKTHFCVNSSGQTHFCD